jgi:eukaryotic-like serine/threonine-protein kinase
VAVAPDGRSLVTSLGMRRSAIWIRDAQGERAATSEGYASAAHMSRDGARVFYILRQDPGARSGDLRVMDLRSGRTTAVLPGVPITDFDISGDETQVAFTVVDGRGHPQIWSGPLDRSTSPRLVALSGDQVSFGASGDIIFRSLEERSNAVIRMALDGSASERVSAPPVMEKGKVSPDGQWVIVHSPGSGEHAVLSTVAVPVNGGAPVTICYPVYCFAAWSADGRFFYVPVNLSPATTFPRSTLAIPVPSGRALPELPPSGLDLSGPVEVEGAILVDRGSIAPGPDPRTYAYTSAELHRNLYRIPLH